MNKYSCESCGREVIAPHSAAKVDMVCCKEGTPVKFNKVGEKLIIPATKIPETKEIPTVVKK